MHKLCFIFIALAILLLCGCATNNSVSKIYSGDYFYNSETASFTPQGSTMPWCVDGTKLKGAEFPSNGSIPSSYGVAKIQVRGKLSAKGNYCHLGLYNYFFDISEVISITYRKRNKS